MFAIAGADIIYSTRLQQKRFTQPEDAGKYRGLYRMNAQLIKKCCKPDVVLMHPLPRDGRPEAMEADGIDMSTVIVEYVEEAGFGSGLTAS